MSFLSDLFFSDLRAEILRLLFGLRTKRMYRAEIIKVTSFKGASVEEELAKLMKLELLVSTRDGNRVYYTANQSHPIYLELRNIVLKTIGLHDILHAALQSPKIEHAFVFGSLAQLTERAESDVDLMVIGTLGRRELTTLLQGVADQVGREINSHIYSHDEISRRLAARDHFLKDVLSKPKLFIRGNEHEFTELVEQRLAPPAQNQP